MQFKLQYTVNMQMKLQVPMNLHNSTVCTADNIHITAGLVLRVNTFVLL